MIQDALQHRGHHEGGRHAVLLHNAQPLSGVETRLHHVGIARVEIAQYTDGAADVEERDAHHADRGWFVHAERCCDSSDSRAQLSLGDADGLRQSGGAAGEQDQRVAVVDVLGDRRCVRLFVGQEVRGREHLGQTRINEPADIRLPRNTDRGAPGVLDQSPQLRWRQGWVHQCRRSADPRGAEHRRDRRHASDVDDSDALARQSTIGQAPAALLDRRGQFAVSDDVPIDDERGTAGVPRRGGIDDRSDVHVRLNTVVTTRMSAAAGWSTGRASRERRASTFRVRGVRAESRSEGV